MTRGHLAAWLVGASAVAITAPAFAAPLVISASDEGEGARVSARFADGRAAAPVANARVDGSTLIVSFEEPVEADVSKLAAGAPNTIAFARLDADGRSLRIMLRKALAARTAAVGASQIVSLAAPPKPKPAPKRDDDPGAAIDVGVVAGLTASTLADDVMMTVGARPEFTRLSFLFPHGATVIPVQTGDTLTLKFSRPGEVDISELRIAPPKFVKDARKLSKPGQPLVLQLTLQPGVKQRHFVEGPRAVVDLLPPEPAKVPPPQVAAKAAPTQPAKPPPEIDPTPRGGVVRVAEEEGASATTFTLRWAAPARAAAFRRGEAIWLVFDANAKLDISGAPLVGKRHTNMQVVNGDHVAALRIAAPPEILVTAKADGPTWTFILSERAAPLAAVAPVSREAGVNGGGARLIADFAREGTVRWIDDPEIGDRFAAALLSGPIKGVDVRRATMEAALLPAAQGAAIEPRADGVGAAFENGQLVISRGQGLLVAGVGGPAGEATEPAGDLSAPVLLDLAAWGGSPKARAIDVLDRLQRAAAVEGVDSGAKADARMQLARFLLANELSAEALGALRVAALNQPELQGQADFKLMRAAANLMLGRVKDAQVDLAAGVLADDASAALWRGYAYAKEENWPSARRALEQGRPALLTQPRAWRARFNLALGEAALELNDFAAAESAIAAALGEAASDDQHAQAQFLQGRLAYARNDLTGALAIFDKLAQGHDEGTLVQAVLEGVKVKRELGKMTPGQAADTLEALRFRWRGDDTELEIIQALGHTYEDMGRWREALSVMHAASARFPALPAARRLRIDMGSMFERLFLEGEANQLQPIQALGLFYEFKDLTPIGASGDRMIRLLSARLVQVDLLEKASELLQYQVDNRLDGVGQAQVAVDLASIYLADRQPQKAIMAIENTRQPGVPTEIAGQRRIIEAKALTDIAQYDHAIELLEKDTSVEAANIRAEVAWRRKAWPQAAAGMLIVLQRRPDAKADLTADERTLVLRAAIAATLAESKPLLDRIRATYAAQMSKSPDADAFTLVTSSPDPSDYRLKDLARRVAQTDLIAKVLQDLKARLAKDVAPKA